MFRLTRVLIALILTYLLVAQAEVTPRLIARDEDSSIFKRSMLNIVWGCVSTTIICAWATIHPNIPPRESRLKRTFRRLELMFWAIVAPEILPCWALNQMLAAITVRDVYNEGKGYETKRRGIWGTVKGWVSLYDTEEPGPAWTMAHGHFLVMGGFHVVEPPEVLDRSNHEANTNTQAVLLIAGTTTDSEKGPSEKKPKGRVTILTLELLQKLVKDPDFEIQTTEEDITDKSKGDALSKLIFILQSTWFILQCVGRRMQGLNLTHLELTTLALASLNGITFILWWDKPLGAEAVVRVHLKRKLTDSERVPREDGCSARSRMILRVRKFLGACVSTIRDGFRGQPRGLVLLPLAILSLLLYPIIAFATAFFATLYDLVQGSSSFFPDDGHLCTFYVPKHRYHKRYHILLLVSLGVVFGGIHCAGWNFSFPTYTEQKLWRVASLAVTIIPIITFPFVVMALILERFVPTTVVDGLVTMNYIVCAPSYVYARLVLLILALALLRHLPPTAFIAVNWTKFYPHFL